jgi:hypothetical protein
MKTDVIFMNTKYYECLGTDKIDTSFFLDRNFEFHVVSHGNNHSLSQVPLFIPIQKLKIGDRHRDSQSEDGSLDIFDSHPMKTSIIATPPVSKPPLLIS